MRYKHDIHSSSNMTVIIVLLFILVVLGVLINLLHVEVPEKTDRTFVLYLVFIHHFIHESYHPVLSFPLTLTETLPILSFSYKGPSPLSTAKNAVRP